VAPIPEYSYRTRGSHRRQASSGRRRGWCLGRRRLRFDRRRWSPPKITLSNSQVRAIGILLKKVVPDLAQIQIAGEVQHKYVVEVPPLLTKDEWQKKYRVTRQEPPPTLELEPLSMPPLITSTK
jgi:hypothetical protein